MNVAQLKRVVGDAVDGRRGRFPRSNERGSIEACPSRPPDTRP